MIFDGKICQITHEGLNENLFKLRPVWCEYYAPSEISSLVHMGEERSFLESHLINNASKYDEDNTYYSLPQPEIWNENLPEFIHIDARLKLLGGTYPGFLWIAGGFLTGVSIFSLNQVFDFSQAEELREENAVALTGLDKRSKEGFVKINILLEKPVSGLVAERELHVPV